MKFNPYQEGYKVGLNANSNDSPLCPYVHNNDIRDWTDGWYDGFYEQDYVVFDGVKILLGKEI